MGRAPITAVMKARYYVELAREGRLPRSFAEEYGSTPERFFRCSAELRERYREAFDKIPWEAVGLYSYLYDRIRTGLQQLMAGSRRFRLDLLDRSNLVALTERASKVTGIPMPHESDLALIEQILSSS